MISLLINHLAGVLSQYEPLAELEARVGRGAFPVEAEGLAGALLPLVAERVSAGRSCLLIVPTEAEAGEMVEDLAVFQPDGGRREARDLRQAALFPAWGTLPYGDGRPLPSVAGERASVLARLRGGEPLLVVASLRTALHPLPPPAYLAGETLELRAGQRLDPAELATRLQSLGYLRVPRVSLHGEFALRGEVADVYPHGSQEALRLVFDLDRLAELRGFDPISQVSTPVQGGAAAKPAVGGQPAVGGARLPLQARVPPVREVLFSPGTLRTLRRRLAGGGASPLLRQDASRLEDLLERLTLDPETPGAEYLYPLCFEAPCSLTDYLGEGSLLFLVDPERLSSGSAAMRKEYLELYRRAQSRRPARGSSPEERPPEPQAGYAPQTAGFAPPPRHILLEYSSLEKSFPRRVRFHALKGSAEEGPRLAFGCDPPRSFFGNIPFFREELANLLGLGYRIYIFAEYPHQAERLRFLLKDLPVEVFPEGISRGFALPQLKILVIQENEIFGRKKRIPRSLASAKSQAIDSFVDLAPGDFVVHLHYGIGLFQGIERIRAAGHERDYIALAYDGGEKVFLPIEQVNLIQRYVGQEARAPKLDRLGGKGWQNKKERVRRSVQDMARRLAALYARRNAAQGFAFGPDTDWQSEFEARFPYQETEDQLAAIEAVKLDMESLRPMDRLICGDVGYGKTEVALRAAFKAVMGGKQVAMLAPTTILAEQHFETFQERFHGFPVRVEMLSRFLAPSSQKAVVRGLAEGRVDVVIGTHRLLQPDVRFKNLGLMVVDEEQRFGVRDKERLKELRASVDCLTLTATPIPRTLHMSLMKIRDMSVIETPPANRYPIETFIQEFDEELVARAVRQELDRGGQVYYLHNRIETMQRVQSFLARLLPEVRVITAHGQLDGEELEEVMHGFVRGDYQVLLATAIIENGLDIPNVNTIIIDRADMFGISQLYQLRGRVGRSDQPAYAYLFYPDRRVISELAMKRLRIISDFTELGSGFRIALKDLEIRGAGNLLGREQHGDILAVGLDMYLKMLDQAVGELAEQKREEPPEVYLELEYSGFIPDSYIAEAMAKMEMYKKIASIASVPELEAVERELEDRFGPPPEEVRSLFGIAEIRVLCRRLYISSLKESKGVARVEFSRVAHVSVDRVLRLIEESGGSVALDPQAPQCLLIRTGSVGLKEKSEFISERLSRLQ
jgi:transcription-repair coupling factor (superfamily II helicase)